jgi:Protein of unknown function (DUF2849)
MTSPLEQKKLKITGPVVITANRLADGAVIYRRAGGWTTDINIATVATTAAAASALLSAGHADDLNAVGAYIAPVARNPDGTLRPGNLREHIRLTGPSIDLPVTFGI